MKPLLNKITKPFLIYVLIILSLSIPVYYWVIEKIWVTELDEYNMLLAERTEAAFHSLQLTGEERAGKVKFWNDIQPGLVIKELPAGTSLKDSIFTADANSPYAPENADDNFRILITTIRINGKPYYFRAMTSFEDTRETVMAIALITAFFFACILIGLFILNRRLSKTAWLPFRRTLQQLKTFNLNRGTKIDFGETDILEFAELNRSLTALIEQNISAYNTQKEFTENASHELQTPLAILKNKLDLLLQNEDLTEKQYHIAEEMNKALARSARTNKNLLLLAKIDNSQFDASETINLDGLLKQSMEAIHEHAEQKHIALSLHSMPAFQINGNESLTEILLNNLLLNAIRYTPPGGSMDVTLTGSHIVIKNSGEQALNPDLLFRRFSKIPASNSGSGLGLAIVSHICKFHGWQAGYDFENGYHIFSVSF